MQLDIGEPKNKLKVVHPNRLGVTDGVVNIQAAPKNLVSKIDSVNDLDAGLIYSKKESLSPYNLPAFSLEFLRSKGLNSIIIGLFC